MIDGKEIMSEEEFINQQNLIEERGWTKSLITLFLKEPDSSKQNPFYKSASPMKLYSKARVNQIEASDEFQSKMKSVEKRRVAAKKRVEQKRQEMIKYMETLIIVIPEYSREELIHFACDHYNEHQSFRLALKGNFSDPEAEATSNSDEEFLKRISVNFLRHSEVKVVDSNRTSFSDYEKELEKLFGEIGRGDGYVILKKRINEEIYKKYPYLKGN